MFATVRNKFTTLITRVGEPVSVCRCRSTPRGVLVMMIDFHLSFAAGGVSDQETYSGCMLLQPLRAMLDTVKRCGRSRLYRMYHSGRISRVKVNSSNHMTILLRSTCSPSAGPKSVHRDTVSESGASRKLLHRAYWKPHQASSIVTAGVYRTISSRSCC